MWANKNPPQGLRTPPKTPAAKTSLAEPTARAISLLTKKIPEPIVSLITIAVAAHRPRPRTRSDRSGGLFGLGLVACTKDDRAYYQGPGWSTNEGPGQREDKREIDVLRPWASFTRYHGTRNGGGT